MAATDELSVGRGRAEQIASRAMARVSSRPRLRSLAAAIAGTAFAVVSVTGLGAVADSAVPGDSLYPVDRAYEAVGRVIGRNADRTQETLQEAITLAQRGDRERAVVHVATELGSLVDSDASPDIPLGAPTADEDVDVPPQIEEPTAPAVTTPAAEAAGAAEPAQVPWGAPDAGGDLINTLRGNIRRKERGGEIGPAGRCVHGCPPFGGCSGP